MAIRALCLFSASASALSLGVTAANSAVQSSATNVRSGDLLIFTNNITTDPWAGGLSDGIYGVSVRFSMLKSRLTFAQGSGRADDTSEMM